MLCIQEILDRPKLAKNRLQTKYGLDEREFALAINCKMMEEHGDFTDEPLSFYKLQSEDKLQHKRKIRRKAL